MSTGNGIITRGVRFEADVRTLLNEVSPKLPDLCRSHYINPWSLAKPVVKADPFPDRDNVDTIGALGGIVRVVDAWYRGDNHQCGFYIEQYSSAEAVANPSPFDWQYIRPKGGEKEPCRILDFDGYWHAAPPPFSGLNLPNVVYAGQSCTVSLARGLQPSSGSETFHHNVTLEDIYVASVGWMSQLYFGCLVLQVNSDGSETTLREATASLRSTSSVTLTIPSTVAEGTQLRFVPYYCSRHFDSSGRPILTIPSIYFSIPGMSSQYATANSKTGSVTEATGLNTTLYGKFSTYPAHSGNGYSIGNLTLRAGATTTSTGTVTMSNAVVRVWHNGKIVWYENLSNVTLTALSPWERQWTFGTPLVASASGGWAAGSWEVEFNCLLSSTSGGNSGTFNKKIRVLRPATSGDIIVVD